MALDFWRERGTPLERQTFRWRDLAPTPMSKLDDDALSRVRVLLMNGIESEALRFGHGAARVDRELRPELARVRRVEQHQRTMVSWLLPADLGPLETTLAFEQVAIEVTAAVAQREPDPHLARVYRFGLLEDCDHLYRFSALMDRVDGGDPNVILQSYTDILPGRPTSVEHRAPEDDLRRPFDRRSAQALTLLHALTITAGEHQTHDFYMTVGPMFADPVARQLYAEISSIEEQHVTQYGSLLDPDTPLLEQWLLHELNEVYNYYGCLRSETNPRVRAIWERLLDFELGHLHHVIDLARRAGGRDPEELLPRELPEPIDHGSHRRFVLETLRAEADLRTRGADLVPAGGESPATLEYRRRMNSGGSPSETVARGYVYAPGGELAEDGLSLVEQEAR